MFEYKSKCGRFHSEVVLFKDGVVIWLIDFSDKSNFWFESVFLDRLLLPSSNSFVELIRVSWGHFNGAGIWIVMDLNEKIVHYYSGALKNGVPSGKGELYEWLKYFKG